MAYEIKLDDKGEPVVFDKEFDVSLHRTQAGTSNMIDLYKFFHRGREIEFSVAYKRGGIFGVKNIGNIEGISHEIFKECFEFLFKYREKKANAKFEINYFFS